MNEQPRAQVSAKYVHVVNYPARTSKRKGSRGAGAEASPTSHTKGIPEK